MGTTPYKFKQTRALRLPLKREAFVAIRRFMCDGDITLRQDEEEILNRWIYADALLRAKEKDEDAMIRDIADKFGISPTTARTDIANAQRLFADARKLNKKYLIHLHLQRIDEDIQKIRKRLFKANTIDGKEIDSVPDAKETASLAKLFETYTYTLNSIPDETILDKTPPPVFQFILAPGQIIEKPMDADEAMRKADEILMKEREDGVYEMPEENDADTE